MPVGEAETLEVKVLEGLTESEGPVLEEGQGVPLMLLEALGEGECAGERETVTQPEALGDTVGWVEGLGVPVAASVPVCEVLPWGDAVALPQPVKLTEALPLGLEKVLHVPLAEREPVGVGGGPFDCVTDTVMLSVVQGELLRVASAVAVGERAALAV